MIENKIENIFGNQVKDIINKCANDEGNYLVTLRMEYINTWEQFAEAVGNAYQLPMRNEGVDGTLDWMQDLEWLNKESYTLILYNFLNLKNEELKDLIKLFLKEILEWWEKDVIKCCVGGEAKSFNVFLVD